MFGRYVRPISCFQNNNNLIFGNVSKCSVTDKFNSSNSRIHKLNFAGNHVHHLQFASRYSSDPKVTIKSTEQSEKPFSPSSKENQDSGPERLQPPNHDELELIKEHMIQYIPFFFTMSHQYKIYKKDIIFENNIVYPQKVIVGLSRYAFEVAKLRMYAHCKYANVKSSVISADISPINGSVRIHWKVAGISQKSAFMFWNFLPWKYRSSMDNQSLATEGVSTFYVNGGDGLIIKHRLDNVILDEDTSEKNKLRQKSDKLGFT